MDAVASADAITPNYPSHVPPELVIRTRLLRGRPAARAFSTPRTIMRCRDAGC
jgi:hypothetical protein